METLENKNLKVNFIGDIVEIISERVKDVGIRIELVNPALTPDSPERAIYRVNLINSREEIRSGGAYVMRDGTIIKFGKELSEYKRSHPCP